MNFFKRMRIDVVIFVFVLVYLIGNQIFGMIKSKEDAASNDPDAKILTIAPVSQVCIEETGAATICYDVDKVPYKIFLVKDRTDQSHQILITSAKGH